MPTILVLFLSITIVCSTLAHASECELSVGVVPQFEQRRIVQVWSELLTHLEQETGCAFTLAGTQTILEFEQRFKAGEYDLAYMNPYHAVMANDAQGYAPLLRSDAKMLKGILTVHKDSGITDVKQLDGKTIAFPSPNALGASLLMRAELKRKYGINIKPLYVKTHSSTYLHVAKKLTQAGGGVMRTLKEQRASLQNLLDIIHVTTPVYAHPIVLHPRIDGEQGERIKQAIMRSADEQPDLFSGIPMQQPVATSMQDYNSLRDLGLADFVGAKE